MRIFEKYEMVKIKCPVCGCKNKVHTELLDRNGVFKGYSLKCCNCGNYNRFLLNYEDNGKENELIFDNGRQRCIQPSFCPRKDCKLYGTGRLHRGCPNKNINKKQIPCQHICNDINKPHVEVVNPDKFI